MAFEFNLKNWTALLVLFTQSLCGTLSFADSLDGNIIKNERGSFYQSANSKFPIEIQYASKEVKDAIDKLESGDYISGSGEYDNTNKKLLVKSVDYVGLKKVLGTWIGTSGIFAFESFSDLMIYTPIFQNGTIQVGPNKAGKKLKYSISPSEGSSWTLFMTDSVSTFLADLEITRDLAKLTIYDPDNGVIKSVLYLTKFSSDRNVRR